MRASIPVSGRNSSYRVAPLLYQDFHLAGIANPFCSRSNSSLQKLALLHWQGRIRPSFLIVATLSFTDTLVLYGVSATPSFSANPELALPLVQLRSAHDALLNNCCHCYWRGFYFGLCHSHHLHQGCQILHE